MVFGADQAALPKIVGAQTCSHRLFFWKTGVAESCMLLALDVHQRPCVANPMKSFDNPSGIVAPNLGVVPAC